ncbi:MAG: HU family DNA-binding protein [Bacteroidia bacterium]
MTKAQVIKEIAKKNGIESVQVEAIIEIFMNTIKEQLTNNKPVRLSGFGSFMLKKRAAKKARIILEKREIIVPEHFIPSFKPSKKFRSKVKEKVK